MKIIDLINYTFILYISRFNVIKIMTAKKGAP